MAPAVAKGMTKTHRLLAAVALATGASALAAPAASAADASGRLMQPVSVTGVLDDLAASPVPAGDRAEVPSVSHGLDGLDGLSKVNELHQLTDLAAPVTGLLPSVQ